MKTKHWITLTIGIAIVLGIYAVPAITQTQPQGQQQQEPLPYLVAVIDLAQVIKQHPDFIARQTSLATEVKTTEETFQKREAEILAQRKALESSTTYKPGTAEYQQQLDIIANKVADFERDAKTYQRKFAIENSKIMYDTYKDIKAAIERYATSMRIAQVTDYRELEVNPLEPQTVAEDMDQRLVWFNSRLNITSQIINEVLAAHATRNGLPRTAAAPPAAPAGQQPQRLQ